MRFPKTKERAQGEERPSFKAEGGHHWVQSRKGNKKKTRPDGSSKEKEGGGGDREKRGRALSAVEQGRLALQGGGRKTPPSREGARGESRLTALAL